MTDEDKQNIKEQFSYIVKEGIAPILKSAGFGKKGNNFHARIGELDWCVNIQKDRWGFDGYFNTWEFTINIGITWRDYAMCVFNGDRDFPLEGSCPLRARIGEFMGKGDYWFELHPNRECSPVKDLVCSTIKDKVLPLSDRIECVNDLWKLIVDNRSGRGSWTRLFRIGSEQKVFRITPIGFYMLCLATGKAEKAKRWRNEMEQRGSCTELLDKIGATYEKRRNHETDR